MWYQIRKEKISWADRVRNEEVLHRVNEDRSMLHIIKRRTTTGLATACVGTVFKNTMFEERQNGR
jgi:hypothetical protein